MTLELVDYKNLEKNTTYGLLSESNEEFSYVSYNGIEQKVITYPLAIKYLGNDTCMELVSRRIYPIKFFDDIDNLNMFYSKTVILCLN